MNKKKACLNLNCSDYKKIKYKVSEKMCPHCKKPLEFVCAKKGCYKVISEKQKDKYCPICKAEIDDTKAAAWNHVKNIGSVTLGIALTLVSTKFSGKKK